VGAADLLKKLNTFLTANGWTKLRGETDHAVASPKAARYWRINVHETIGTFDDWREVRQLQWRTTPGGANVATNGSSYRFSSVAVGSGANLVAGTSPYLESARIFQDRWWVEYDFGSATVIRELVVVCDTVSEAPRKFDVQWSNDRFTWTTMVTYDAAHFSTVGQSVTFTWDAGGGYTDARHPSGTVARRGGLATNTAPTDNYIDAEACNDLWAWQGPGFDAARRVYVFAAPYYDGGTGTEMVRFQCCTGVDANAVSWFDVQQGAGTDSAFLLLATSSVTHWFYANSRRFVVVVKNGTDDYTSAYLGFLQQFALPDDYPFPLFQGATAPDLNARLSYNDSRYRAFCDPGDVGCATFRRWDNVWERVENHNLVVGGIDDVVRDPTAWVWPWHVGVTNQASFPSNTIGNYNSFNAHYLNRIDPTAQGDLPLIPAIVMDDPYGNIGALDGVFCVPRGGVLSPEQVVTISSVDYRVFSNRAKTGGHHYYAVRAD
jgi:hypothetical protein